MNAENKPSVVTANTKSKRATTDFRASFFHKITRSRHFSGFQP